MVLVSAIRQRCSCSCLQPVITLASLNIVKPFCVCNYNQSLLIMSVISLKFLMSLITVRLLFLFLPFLFFCFVLKSFHIGDIRLITVRRYVRYYVTSDVTFCARNQSIGISCVCDDATCCGCPWLQSNSWRYLLSSWLNETLLTFLIAFKHYILFLSFSFHD